MGPALCRPFVFLGGEFDKFLLAGRGLGNRLR